MRLLVSLILLSIVMMANAKPPRGTSGEFTQADYEQLNAQIAKTLANDGYDNAPQVIKGYKPLYPASRFLSGISGSCTVAFTVNESGVPVDIERGRKEDDEKMCNHAIHALRLWQFDPARKAGAAVQVRLQMPFGFVAR